MKEIENLLNQAYETKKSSERIHFIEQLKGEEVFFNVKKMTFDGHEDEVSVIEFNKFGKDLNTTAVTFYLSEDHDNVNKSYGCATWENALDIVKNMNIDGIIVRARNEAWLSINKKLIIGLLELYNE